MKGKNNMTKIEKFNEFVAKHRNGISTCSSIMEYQAVINMIMMACSSIGIKGVKISRIAFAGITFGLSIGSLFLKVLNEREK